MDEAEYVRARVEATEDGPRRGRVPKMDVDDEWRLLEAFGTIGADLLLKKISKINLDFDQRTLTVGEGSLYT